MPGITISQSTVDEAYRQMSTLANQVRTRTGTAQQTAINRLSPYVGRALGYIATQATMIGVPLSDVGRHPPDGVQPSNWRRYVDMANRAAYTMRTDGRTRAEAQQAPTPAEPAKQAPTEEQLSLIQRTQATRVPTATSGRAPAAAREPTTEPITRLTPGQLGLFRAWGEATRVLFGIPTDLLPTEMFASGRVPVLDRLQTVVEILNPTGVPLYRRPWFPPAALAVISFAGWKIYEASQAQKGKASAKEAGPPPGAVPVAAPKGA